MAGGRRFSALLGTVHWTQRYDPLIVFRSPLEESPSETEAACSGGRAAALPPGSASGQTWTSPFNCFSCHSQGSPRPGLLLFEHLAPRLMFDHLAC